MRIIDERDSGKRLRINPRLPVGDGVILYHSI